MLECERNKSSTLAYAQNANLYYRNMDPAITWNCFSYYFEGLQFGLRCYALVGLDSFTELPIYIFSIYTCIYTYLDREWEKRLKDGAREE